MGVVLLHVAPPRGEPARDEASAGRHPQEGVALLEVAASFVEEGIQNAVVVVGEAAARIVVVHNAEGMLVVGY